MTLNAEIIINLFAYAITIGVVYGSIRQQIKQLAEKVDKHNNLIERMYQVESQIEIIENKLEDK